MPKARISIDGIALKLEAGAPVGPAARAAGIAWPSFCGRLEGAGACMACFVEEGGRLEAPCASVAREGAVFITKGSRVEAASLSSLALLLSEHSGDCRAPCERACPAGFDPMAFLEALAAGREVDAAGFAWERLILPRTIEGICAAYCRGACRRGLLDRAIDIPSLVAGTCDRFPVHAPSPSRGYGVDERRFRVSGGGLRAWATAAYLARSGWRVCVVAPTFAPDPGDLAELGIEVDPPACRDDIEVDARGAPEAIPAKDVAWGAALARTVLGSEGRPPARSWESVIRSPSRAYLESLSAHSLHPDGERSGEPGLRGEASRCLSCGCHASACSLREAAVASGAQAKQRSAAASAKKAAFRETHRHSGGALVYEGGKCVRCGRCIDASRSLGPALSFVGRGFGFKIEGFADLLASGDAPAIAFKLSSLCPTGALHVVRY